MYEEAVSVRNQNYNKYVDPYVFSRFILHFYALGPIPFLPLTPSPCFEGVRGRNGIGP
jgi:hypothetical protein